MSHGPGHVKICDTKRKCRLRIQVSHLSLNSGQRFRLTLQKGSQSGDALPILAHIRVEELEGKSERVKFSRRTTNTTKPSSCVHGKVYRVCLC